MKCVILYWIKESYTNYNESFLSSYTHNYLITTNVCWIVILSAIYALLNTERFHSNIHRQKRHKGLCRQQDSTNQPTKTLGHHFDLQIIEHPPTYGEILYSERTHGVRSSPNAKEWSTRTCKVGYYTNVDCRKDGKQDILTIDDWLSRNNELFTRFCNTCLLGLHPWNASSIFYP